MNSVGQATVEAPTLSSASKASRERLQGAVQGTLEVLGETRRRFFAEAERAEDQGLARLFWELGDAEEVLLGVLEQVEI